MGGWTAGRAAGRRPGGGWGMSGWVGGWVRGIGRQLKLGQVYQDIHMGGCVLWLGWIWKGWVGL